MLLEQIAVAYWRLRRSLSAEAGQVAEVRQVTRMVKSAKDSRTLPFLRRDRLDLIVRRVATLSSLGVVRRHEPLHDGPTNKKSLPTPVGRLSLTDHCQL